MEEEPRATEEIGAVGHSVEPLDPSTAVGGSVVTGKSSGDGGSSGAGSGDIDPNRSPPRNPERGKGAIVEGEQTTEIPYREEDVLLRPATTAAISSSHRQITKYDVTEHLTDEALAKLLEDNPAIRELVLKAKEDQARAIEASEATERAKREKVKRERCGGGGKGQKRGPVATSDSCGRGRRSKVHLSCLPALKDLRVASCSNWGGATLGATYGFLGYSIRTEQSTASYWRVWENKCPDLKTLPRALIWSKEYIGEKNGRGDLNAFRLYLDDLRASQIEWNPWSTEGPEPKYLARSRAITASRVLPESVFGWQWYLGIE
ncbi:hypothetical protein RHMOL_Rhmol06G0186500 [Rhododendron molle]|uniref:Uncharacterized protein n=1 Tax=Rhododendron molle TaxID=49168 RepID=A0ACC0NFD1_RHOML|nr:hypothetical protein RHMOL_Rhmol06G0186500 [Rhododendron molle]